MPTSRPFDFNEAIARMPRWMLALALAGTVCSLVFAGITYGGGFLLGSLVGYLNFRLVERSVGALARRATGGESNPGAGTAGWVFIRFTGLLLGAFVILRSSGFSLVAAFFGFLVCPAGAVLEIVYELVTYDHT